MWKKVRQLGCGVEGGIWVDATSLSQWRGSACDIPKLPESARGGTPWNEFSKDRYGTEPGETKPGIHSFIFAFRMVGGNRKKSAPGHKTIQNVIARLNREPLKCNDSTSGSSGCISFSSENSPAADTEIRTAEGICYPFPHHHAGTGNGSGGKQNGREIQTPTLGKPSMSVGATTRAPKWGMPAEAEAAAEVVGDRRAALVRSRWSRLSIPNAGLCTDRLRSGAVEGRLSQIEREAGGKARLMWRNPGPLIECILKGRRNCVPPSHICGPTSDGAMSCEGKIRSAPLSCFVQDDLQ